MMERFSRMKLSAYLLLTSVTFSYMVLLPQGAGAGVLAFMLLQFASIVFILPNKKVLWWLLPAAVLSMNFFLSGNGIWRASNGMVLLLLFAGMYCSMQKKFDWRDTSPRFFGKVFESLFSAVINAFVPFGWVGKIEKRHLSLIKRISIGIFLSIPCLLFLILLLSSADEVFCHSIEEVCTRLFNLVSWNVCYKIFLGGLAGMYLFGLLYSVFQPPAEEEVHLPAPKNRDALVLNIVLATVLSTYTAFIFIQFKYLFAGTSLPYGLSYTNYARRGFFELLFLSGVNLAVILFSVGMTKKKTGLSRGLTQGFCCYLCVITFVLLASSFYRMRLYCADDGLTRLRLLVLGFLLFESLGLIGTLLYIVRPKFNIIALYLTVGLSYYLLLNLIPIDRLVAKDQIDRYFSGRTDGVAYVMTLSSDAAPEIRRLLEPQVTGQKTRELARAYFQELQEPNLVPRWQRYNLSVSRALQIAEQLEQ